MRKLPTGELSLWEGDLQARALPGICVKSGAPAADTLRVQFQNSSFAAFAGLVPGRVSRRYVVRGHLPMSMPWILCITTLRLLVIASLFGSIYGLWSLTIGHGSALVAWVALIASFLVAQLWRIFRARVEPTGEVHRDGVGTAWVRVRGLHPNFVAAVEAWRAQAVGPGRAILTPDGRWWWDGTRLLPVSGTPSQPRDSYRT